MGRAYAYWRRHRITFAFLLIVIVSGVGLLAWQHEVDARLRADCEQANTNTRVVRALVAEAINPSGAAAVDLTQVEGFASLDAETQSYLVALGTALSVVPSNARDRLERFADRLPIRDCSDLSA